MKNIQNVPGIYAITNTANNKKYVGSAKKSRDRLVRHLSQLRSGTHCNKRLQHAWSKYTESTFSFSVVELVDDPINLISREQFWIDYFGSANRNTGYNICPTAGSHLGRKSTLSSRKKMSLARLGIKRSPEIGLKISASLKGRTLAPATLARMSAANMGKKQTAEHIAARVTKIVGRTYSAEVRARVSAALTGRSFSTEHRVALSKAAKNRKTQSFTGKTHSLKSRAKISAHARTRIREKDKLGRFVRVGKP